ncbi:unnamed protein product, partial [Polarella glacialis]
QRLGPDREEQFPNGTRCRVLGFTEVAPQVFDHRHPDFDAEALPSVAERQFLLRHGGRLPRIEALDATETPGLGGGHVLYPSTFGDEQGGGTVQLPVRLGWALTAHRAQGLSLGACVVHLRGIFCAGQAYVAMSRCRTASDLWIEGLPRREADGRVPAFAPDPKVEAFYARLRSGGE